MPFRNSHLSREVRGKLRQFYRLILSYGDFKQAKYAASYILEERLHESKDRRPLEAMNTAMIVAYCRPFSGNDNRNDLKIPDLPKSLLKDFTENELFVHKTALDDRNSALAHTDSLAAELEPEVLDINGKKTLMPWMNDMRAPLNREATEILLSLAEKLHIRTLDKRVEMEGDLLQYFPTVTPEELINKSKLESENVNFIKKISRNLTNKFRKLIGHMNI